MEIDQEKTLEDWLESNSNMILEKDLLIIRRQVRTDMGGFIDLLGVDREGNVVIVELKRDQTPRETIAQALEYAAYAERLDVDQLEAIFHSYRSDKSLGLAEGLAEKHRKYFALDESEAVAFNKDQRIVVVGQQVTPAIKQTASFLNAKGVRVTCVEFTFFEADGGDRLMSQEIVVEEEQPPGLDGRILAEKKFLESLDNNGRAFFSRLIQWAKMKSMGIYWFYNGFYLYVSFSRIRIPVCYGYTPSSKWGQVLMTTFADDQYSIEAQCAIPQPTLQKLKEQAAKVTDQFEPNGSEDRIWPINREWTEAEETSLREWCEAVAKAIQEYGLKE